MFLGHLVDNSLWTSPGLSIWPGNTALQTKCAAPHIHTADTDGEQRRWARKTRECSFKHLCLLSIYFLSLLNISLSLSLSLSFSTLTPSFLPYFYSQVILLLRGGVSPLQLEWSVAYVWTQSILPSAVCACVCPVCTNFIDTIQLQREGKKSFLVQFIRWLGAYCTQTEDSQM
jgi:hypothetical protein